MTASAALSLASSITLVRTMPICISTRSAFRWSQRVVAGQAKRRTRRGREVVRPLWSRIAPALQLAVMFRAAVGAPVAWYGAGWNRDPLRRCCVWLRRRGESSVRSMA
jgi:hypothetical protein